jgi:hypothetical protein
MQIQQDPSSVARIGDSFLRGLAVTANLPERLQTMGIAYLHGTSSGSPADLFQSGLLPANQRKQVSFTGEMMGGIVPRNLNSTAISVVAVDQPILAFEYADKMLVGWHPSRSHEMMELSEGWMRSAGASQDDIDEWRPIREKIEQDRITRWDSLTEFDQAIIANPFPVICGISLAVQSFETAANVAGERSIVSAAPHKCTLFVPDDRLLKASELKENYGGTAKLRPMSLLKAV